MGMKAKLLSCPAYALFRRRVRPGLRRAGEQVPKAVEAGAVAGAVPAFLVRVPFELAAQMRAADADRIRRAQKSKGFT